VGQRDIRGDRGGRCDEASEDRAHFFAGILVSIPLAITVWVFAWVFNLVDSFLRPLVADLSGYNIPGVGVAITLLLVYLVGVVASNVLGRRLIRWAESGVARIPVAKYIYSGTRQIIQSFQAPAQTGFMQVVLVEFPRKGTRTIGFITNVLSDDVGGRMYNVFIPTSPNPTSGFLQIVPETEIIRTELSVDDALKMVVSGGRMSPQEVSDKLFVRKDEGGADV
jgi:uncharacterized membrane protein